MDLLGKGTVDWFIPSLSQISATGDRALPGKSAIAPQNGKTRDLFSAAISDVFHLWG